jgi:hypothetical protein
MNLTAELQYLYDKIVKVDIIRHDIYLLNSLRGFINSGCNHQGFRHDIEVSLGKVQDEAVKNRYGKELIAQCKDIDISHAAHDFFYGTMIVYQAIGTKQEANVAKYQGVRIAKAKKVLDLL